jgi:enoyl-CoA hydratase/carnithine racemase
VSESLAYSTLQSGREHRAWLADRGADLAGDRAADRDPAPRVRVRDDGMLREITLDRASRHNAFDARMRHELSDALATAETDPDVRVLLRGAGPSFCSGGDLEEFGTVDDPAQGHRLSARAAAAVHGWCIGAGLELACFAGRVVASSDARFRLPELSMGLIPGAGGTVSIRRRIGPRALLALAIDSTEVDAAWALEHGLVDEVVADRASLARVRP